jgi:hypothetical protein
MANQLKPGHKVAMIIAGVLLASCVVYNIVGFIGGMMYFFSPQPGHMPRYHATYDDFRFTGGSRHSFDEIIIKIPSSAAAGFAIRFPAGNEVALADPSLKEALVHAGAKENDFGGINSLTAGDLYFECDGESVTSIVAGSRYAATSSSNSGTPDAKLVYRGKVLRFPISARQMQRLFGSSYRIEYR